MPVSWQALTERDKRRTVGLSFVLCVAIIWVAASFLVQVIVSIEVQASLPVPANQQRQSLSPVPLRIPKHSLLCSASHFVPCLMALSKAL